MNRDSKSNKGKIIVAVLVIAVVGLFFVFKSSDDEVGSSKNTISRAVGGEPASLDPNHATGTWENVIISDLFTGLVESDAHGNVQPGMAERWTISPDGKEYIFYIRDSKWSDGTPVTAHDFEYGIKRILDPKTAATYASITYVIKGGEGYSGGKLQAGDVGIRALDDKTLKVTLEYPASYFIDMLTHYTFFPLPKHVVEKYGKDWSKPGNMVSNGAYKLLEWRPQSYIKATKNPYFYDAANTMVENVIYYTQSDSSAMLKRFRAKEVDLVVGFSSDQYEWIMENMKDEVRIGPYLGIYFFALDMNGHKNKSLADKRVRQALNMVIDREFITEKVLKSGEVPAYSFVPFGMDGYIPAEFTWKKWSKERRINEAKRLLKEAGFSDKNPLTVEISYNTLEAHKKIVVAISSMWNELGVKSTTFNSEVAVHYKNMQDGDLEVGRAGWIADYPEPSSFLYVGETGVGNNYSQYSNKKYDADIKKAKNSVSKSERYALYKSAETMLLDDVAFIPVYYYVSKNLVSTRIGGWYGNVSDTHLARYMSIK